MTKFNQMQIALSKVRLEARDAEDVQEALEGPGPARADAGLLDDLRRDSAAERDRVQSESPHVLEMPSVAEDRTAGSIPLVSKDAGPKYPHITSVRMGSSLLGYPMKELPTPVGLIVGECPGDSTDPRLPMFPHPEISAAARLLGYSNMEPWDFMTRMLRTNLCPTIWDSEIAELRVQLLKIALMKHRTDLRVLLLGAKVQRAWGIKSREKFGWCTIFYGDASIVVGWIPHPSGLNRLYNEPENQLLAGRYVRWTAGLIRTP